LKGLPSADRRRRRRGRRLVAPDPGRGQRAVAVASA